ncbi:NADP-dependent oxidoreductase [Cytophagaceae bacterium DM2B3-1]|uniref:NADP-dependent oxidoreductase n=1 Tax=Xanthocytophaga flava TaxID=3048013 RepID=A0ABT7CTV4_9BACT|nr:NADP-dependent oxidoreductase [Xanthocytophaga flavus]MDJ1497203.1 NADP-dependent oxidoreductase [Xanthocytophaga flavus]
MKSYILKANGGIENLVESSDSIRDIQPDEVLIKTKAIGINPIDSAVRQYPHMLEMITQSNIPDKVILGWDVAGVIEKVGSQVTSFQEGDAVYGLLNMPGLGRTNATYVAASSTHIALKPAQLTFAQAAAVPMAALTAYQAVLQAQIAPGERVLVHGASGGVGHFAVQIAKQLGAYVIGTSSAKNKAFVESLGVDEWIDYQARPFEEVVAKVDVVIDTVNSVEHIRRSISVLTTGGRLVYLQPHFESQLEDALAKAGVRGYGIFVNSSGENLTKISELIEKGFIRPHVSLEFPFSQLPQAHLALEAGQTPGKIVVGVD